jgi:hypothetical protein
LRTFADLEVPALHLLLRPPHRVGDHASLDRHVLLEPDALYYALHLRPAEEPQQLVLERQVEPRLAGVALAPRPTAQLVVYAARLVALGSEHVEPAEIRHPRTELDVRSPPGHVRRDGNRALLAGFGDDLRLPLVVLGVKDVVLDPAPPEHPREVLGDLDGDRAH